MIRRSGIARGKPVGTVLGGFRSPDLGIPEETGGFPAIAGTMAIASVGISI